MSLRLGQTAAAPGRRGCTSGTRWLVGLTALLFAIPALASSPLVASFRILRGDTEQELVVIRDEQRIEYRFAHGERQLWLRGRDGITLIRMFEQDRRAVEYAPGDLAALHAVPDWESLGELLAPRRRATLTADGQAQWLDHPGALLTDEGSVERALWSTELSLPLWWQQAGQRIELSALSSPSDDPFSAINRFPIIDYADMGDLEKDPFARAFIHFGDGHAHPQGGH